MFSSNQKLLFALWLSNNISPVFPAYEEKHDPLQLIYWLKLVIFSGNAFLKLCPVGQKASKTPSLRRVIYSDRNAKAYIFLSRLWPSEEFLDTVLLFLFLSFKHY